MTGTHDTEPVAVWWDELPARRTRVVLEAAGDCVAQAPAGPTRPGRTGCATPCWSLRSAPGSDRLFLPVQDVFGWRDRINTPGTVTPHNWTWCLPWPVDRIEASDEARERAAFLRRLAEADVAALAGLH